MARRPSRADASAVKTRNGSSVTAKMAGIESTANTTSVASTSTRTASSGVANKRRARPTTAHPREPPSDHHSEVSPGPLRGPPRRDPRTPRGTSEVAVVTTRTRGILPSTNNDK